MNIKKTISLLLMSALFGCAATKPEGPVLPEGNTLLKVVNLEVYSGGYSTLDGKHRMGVHDLDEDKVTVRKWVSGEYREFSGYSESSAKWCSKGVVLRQQEHPSVRLNAALNKICKKRGGYFNQTDGLCRYSNSNNVLFGFNAKYNEVGGYLCPIEVRANILEAVGSSPSPEFLTKINNIKSVNEAPHLAFAAQVEAQIQKAKNIRDAEIRRSVEALPKMKKRGATICKNDPDWSYFAYVEDFTEDRLKILLSRKYMTGSPSITPGNFRQEILWINPIDRWYPCS